ncbi:MAG: hypothetical protein JO303_10690 [Caulobacteraceae bacterium]|nr:hypothetical protein [Caulobacteraceae bacterium]
MSLRMPQNLSTSLRVETGASVLEIELQAERAAALGRLGKDLEKSLAALSAISMEDPARSAAVKAAADAAWRYFVQREACGMLDHDHPIAHYGIPQEVLARVGSVG